VPGPMEWCALPFGNPRPAMYKCRSGPAWHPMRCPTRNRSLSVPPKDAMVARANDVSRPTMTVYVAKGRNTGVAVVVFPGGVTSSGHGTGGHGDLRLADLAQHHLRVAEVTRDRLGPDDEKRTRLLPEGANGAAGRAAHTWAGAPARRGAACRPHKGGVIGFPLAGTSPLPSSTHFAQRTYPPVEARV